MLYEYKMNLQEYKKIFRAPVDLLKQQADLSSWFFFIALDLMSSAENKLWKFAKITCGQ